MHYQGDQATPAAAALRIESLMGGRIV